MKAILGKKVGMSQMFNKKGTRISLTIIESGPCVVVQVKTKEKDGYRAIQIGFGKAKKLNKPQEGHQKGLKENIKYLREIVTTPKEAGQAETPSSALRATKNKQKTHKDAKKGKEEEKKEKIKEGEKEEEVFDLGSLKKGDKFNVSIFYEGDKVDIMGISKGKGFQGVIKRHGFSKGPETHGSHHHRKPGSIGSMFPQRVVKGKKMPGRMGGEQVTVRNLQVVKVDSEKNLLAIKGAVPGAKNSLLLIKSKV